MQYRDVLASMGVYDLDWAEQTVCKAIAAGHITDSDVLEVLRLAQIIAGQNIFYPHMPLDGLDITTAIVQYRRRGTL